MTGYKSKRAAAQDNITDEQGRPMTYWGGKAQPAHVLLAAHREEYWCADLTCKKCYGADFRFKHAPPQRTWVDLTDDDLLKCLVSVDPETKRLPSGLRDFARVVLAKSKEKNNG